jgi:hypothetical protein
MSADVEAGKPGACPLCGLAFSRQVTLKEHLHRKHTVTAVHSQNHNGGFRGRHKKAVSNKWQEIEKGGNGDETIGDGDKNLGDEIHHVHSAEFSVHGGSGVTCGKNRPSLAQSAGREEEGDGQGDGACVTETDVETGTLPQETMHIIINRIKEDVASVDSESLVLPSDQCSIFASPPPSLSPATLHTAVGLGGRIPSHHAPMLTGSPLLQHNHFDTMINGEHLVAIPNPPNFESSQFDKCSSVVESDNLPSTGGDGKMSEAVSVQSSQPSEQQVSSETSENQNSSSLVSFSDSVKTSAGVAVGSVPSRPQTADEDPNFLFLLLNTLGKGKALKHKRQSFRCFHCHYTTGLRRSLVKHMSNSHADHLSVHQCIGVVKEDSLSNTAHGQQVNLFYR